MSNRESVATASARVLVHGAGAYRQDRITKQRSGPRERRSAVIVVTHDRRMIEGFSRQQGADGMLRIGLPNGMMSPNASATLRKAPYLKWVRSCCRQGFGRHDAVAAPRHRPRS